MNDNIKDFQIFGITGYTVMSNYHLQDRNLSINEGAIKVLNLKDDSNIISTQISTVCNYYDIDMDAKIKDIDRKKLDILLFGTPDILEFKYVSKNGNRRTQRDFYEGVITNLERRFVETKSGWIREWIEGYMTELPCPKCHGARLDDSILSVRVNGKNIYELISHMI